VIKRFLVADRCVALSVRAAYVAGIVHRWDLWQPGFPGPSCPRTCPMAPTILSTSLVPVQPVFTDAATAIADRNREPRPRTAVRRGCPPFAKIDFLRRNGLICAAVTTDSVSHLECARMSR
jgi:hypothetical protein